MFLNPKEWTITYTIGTGIDVIFLKPRLVARLKRGKCARLFWGRDESTNSIIYTQIKLFQLVSIVFVVQDQHQVINHLKHEVRRDSLRAEQLLVCQVRIYVPYRVTSDKAKAKI